MLQENLRELKLSDHVGFDSLPDQLVNKSVTRGFSFNILCVGERFTKQFSEIPRAFFMLYNVL